MAEVKKTDMPVIVKKRKANSASTSKEADNKTTPVNQDSVDTEVTIKILFHGSCPKLSTRGVGDLEYELGINDNTGESYIRIAGNASSGAYSTKWVKLDDVRIMLDDIKEETFRAVVLSPIYSGQSSCNAGYLSACIKAEGVLVSMEKQPSFLEKGDWDTLMKKITRLKNDGVSLKDHIAIAAAEKAKKKKARGSKRKVVEKQPVEKM